MRAWTVGLVLSLMAASTARADLADDLRRLVLPPGFAIELYARVPGARSLAVAPEPDAVFVGSRGSAVHAILDAGLAGRPQRVVRMLDGLAVPNGIAWKDGHLYVAEQPHVVRYAFPDPAALTRPPRPEPVLGGLPDKRWHGWRYAAFGPDGGLYLAIGSPCNICETRGMEGSIIRVDTATAAWTLHAQGVRNSVGVDFHPVSGEMYFTDNGADHMGEDSPPDELNHAPGPGLHFGFPWFGGGADRTPDFKDIPLPGPTVPPIVRFGAHVASLGIHFYRGTQFPAAYRHDALVAQHGSWNRSAPDGYRVVRVRMGADRRPVGVEPFIDGFLVDGKPFGRPVDIKELPDGSLLISDDHAGAVYRVRYAP